MKRIDVCMVAGRRPGLLRATLESFEQNLFRNFCIKHFVVNIDPIFGSDDDMQECVEVARSFSKNASVTAPETAGFASAVKHNWASTVSDTVLHLEDDWLLTKPVTDTDIAAFENDASVAQISFNHANKNWNASRRGQYAYTRRTWKVFGIPTPFKAKFPVFTTSPSFLRGTFAREAARLIDPAFDPEKQFFKGVNPTLEAYVSKFRNKVIGEIGDYHIVDIGREWRDQRNIPKTMVGWHSQWVET